MEDLFDFYSFMSLCQLNFKNSQLKNMNFKNHQF